MPIYPEVTIEGKVFFKTVDPHVFIESMFGEGEDRTVVYVNFQEKKRWKQMGDCHSCGLLDWVYVKDPDNPDNLVGIPSPLPGIVLVEGKRLGERYSVKDVNYATRLDVPNTPDYDRVARANAKELGISPYPCGLTFERLGWIE